MKRVHRNLSRDEVEALRGRLTSLVPIESAGVPELLRMMRLIARKSQAEYARMCDVAPRVLANIEGGIGSPTVETLGKLLRPFGYRVGVVMDPATRRKSGVPGTLVDEARKTGSPLRSALNSTHRANQPGAFEKKKRARDDSQAVVESALSRALRKDRRKPDK